MVQIEPLQFALCPLALIQLLGYKVWKLTRSKIFKAIEAKGFVYFYSFLHYYFVVLIYEL